MGLTFSETAVLTSVQDAYEAIYTGRSYQHEMALVDVVLERRLGKWRSEDKEQGGWQSLRDHLQDRAAVNEAGA